MLFQVLLILLLTSFSTHASCVLDVQEILVKQDEQTRALAKKVQPKDDLDYRQVFDEVLEELISPWSEQAQERVREIVAKTNNVKSTRDKDDFTFNLKNEEIVMKTIESNFNTFNYKVFQLHEAVHALTYTLVKERGIDYQSEVLKSPEHGYGYVLIEQVAMEAEYIYLKHFTPEYLRENFTPHASFMEKHRNVHEMTLDQFLAFTRKHRGYDADTLLEEHAYMSASPDEIKRMQKSEAYLFAIIGATGALSYYWLFAD